MLRKFHVVLKPGVKCRLVSLTIYGYFMGFFMGKLRDSVKSHNIPIKKSRNMTILGKGANEWTWRFKMVHQEKRQSFIPNLPALA